MDTYSHTLVAYRISFRYMERNNPKKEELKDKISNGEKPQIDIEYLLQKISSFSSTGNGVYSSKGLAIYVNKIYPVELGSNFKRYHLIPEAGKSGRPFTVRQNNYKHNFSSDAVSLYENHMFIYDFGDNKLFLICHRHGLSGCKQIFSKFVNNLLRDDGIIMDLSFILPPNSQAKDAVPTKLILSSIERSSSGDIADQLVKQNKTNIVTLSLNLNTSKTLCFKQIVNKRIANIISSDEALKELNIQASLNGISMDYNDAKVVMKFGKSSRTFDWENLENLFEGLDITDKILSMSGDFYTKLKICADEYATELEERDQ